MSRTIICASCQLPQILKERADDAPQEAFCEECGPPCRLTPRRPPVRPPSFESTLTASSSASPRSRWRALDPKPRASLLHHGGKPLGRFGPFFVEALGLGLEQPDLLAQLLTIPLEPLAFLLGNLRHPLGLGAFVQQSADILDNSPPFFHPPNHPLPVWSLDHAWHGSLSLTLFVA